MSKLSKQIESSILEFCEVISQKFKLNKSDVYALWNSEDQSAITLVKKEVAVAEITPEKIMTSTKDYLMAYCKSKGLKQSGKKEEIIQRILESLGSSTSTSVPVVKTISKTKMATATVLTSVIENAGTIEVRKNKFGNEEHFESGLVFNKESKIVFGHQNANGKIDSLTDKDIESCKKYKFQYKLPENLSINKGLQNVKIDELEEDDDDEELDEDDIEEELDEMDNEVDLEDD